MIFHEIFEVAVVDLHMPGMSGVDFCRMARSPIMADGARSGQEHSGGGVDNIIVAGGAEAGSSGGGAAGSGVAGGGGVTVVPAERLKLLLHTTAAGSVKSDELEVRNEKNKQFLIDLVTQFSAVSYAGGGCTRS